MEGAWTRWCDGVLVQEDDCPSSGHCSWFGGLFGEWEGSGLDGERENGAYPEGFGEGNGGKQLQADCLFTTDVEASHRYLCRRDL